MYLAKFLVTSTKSFFPCKELENQMQLRIKEFTINNFIKIGVKVKIIQVHFIKLINTSIFSISNCVLNTSLHWSPLVNFVKFYIFLDRRAWLNIRSTNTTGAVMHVCMLETCLVLSFGTEILWWRRLLQSVLQTCKLAPADTHPYYRNSRA